MTSAMSALGVTGIGVGAIAVENIQAGKDPVPSLFAGSIVMLGASIMAQWRPSLGMAFATVFMLGAILTHSTLFARAVDSLSTAAATGGTQSKA